MTMMVNGVSDARTLNNTVRHQYRVLTEEEKAQVTKIQGYGSRLLELP